MPAGRAETDAARTTIVVVTMDRAPTLLRTIDALRGTSPGVPVVVVDNGSRDGTADTVRARHHDVRVIRLERNLGAAGRTAGVRAATTPYVAFSDDDSWWAPGSLVAAADVLDAHPRLGLLAARLLVEPDGRVDPTCDLMADSALADVPGVGPRVLGFVACGAVVRRDAYLQVGGFHPGFGIGGEETLLALDLTSAGWDCAYRDSVVAHHAPDPGAVRPGRARRVVRNDLWTAWLRRPARHGLGQLGSTLARAPRDPAARDGLRDALAGLPWVLRQRRPVDDRIESMLRLLADDEAHGSRPAGNVPLAGG